MNPLETAFITAATEGGAPPLHLVAPADARITPGTGPDIWDGLTVTRWSE